MTRRPRSKRDVPVEHRNLAMSGEERRRLKRQFRERETQGGRPWRLTPKRAGEPTPPKGPTRTVDSASIVKELISERLLTRYRRIYGGDDSRGRPSPGAAKCGPAGYGHVTHPKGKS